MIYANWQKNFTFTYGYGLPNKFGQNRRNHFCPHFQRNPYSFQLICFILMFIDGSGFLNILGWDYNYETFNFPSLGLGFSWQIGRARCNFLKCFISAHSSDFFCLVLPFWHVGLVNTTKSTRITGWPTSPILMLARISMLDFNTFFYHPSATATLPFSQLRVVVIPNYHEGLTLI